MGWGLEEVAKRTRDVSLSGKLNSGNARMPLERIRIRKDMSYWPVHKWTLWIHRQREYSSVSLALGFFFFFFSLLSRRIDEGIEGRAHWHTEEIEDEAEGKIEEVKWKRLPWRGRERGEISILPWDREEIFRSSKTRKIATVSTVERMTTGPRGRRSWKRNRLPPRHPLYIADETGAIYFAAAIATYLWNNG